jgi:hypothetical protein
MLGRIRRRQQDSDPTLVHTQPYTNSRCKDFIKSAMVQARRMWIEYDSMAQKCDTFILIDLKHRRTNFDVTKGTILEYELRSEQLEEVITAIFGMDQGRSFFHGMCVW